MLLLLESPLFARASASRQAAYSPYSGLRVGAALEARNGALFGGCNIENASYPVGICAERSAVAQAVSSGEREFSRLLIVSDGSQPVSPCGLCLQTLAEFAPALEIISVSDSGNAARWWLSELLPAPFTSAALRND